MCWKERIGSIRAAASATPSRYIARRRGQRPKEKPKYNKWEDGTPTDSRGMPYLDNHGAVIGNKKLAETRASYRKHQKSLTDSGTSNS